MFVPTLFAHATSDMSQYEYVSLTTGHQVLKNQLHWPGASLKLTLLGSWPGPYFVVFGLFQPNAWPRCSIVHVAGGCLSFSFHFSLFRIALV